MKLASRDRSMTLAIAAPGMGFTLTLDGHLWLFDRSGQITGSIPPLITVEEVAAGIAKHRTVASPEHCPGCVVFVVFDYRADRGGR